MRVLAVVSYKGTKYQGWQRQTNAPSIQEEIEKVLSKLLNTEIVIYGSGRTDAGVHANGQTFHFDINKESVDLDKLRYSTNCLLPEDIYVKSYEVVNDNFHARYSAVAKTYRYQIQLGERNPLNFETFTWIKEDINFELFSKVLRCFVGKHNFQDFNSKEEDENKFVRTIESISCQFNETCNTIEIIFKGDGFMRYQIRFMVGAALAVAQGKENEIFIVNHLQTNKPREIISYKAPSNGLFLDKVTY